VLTGNPYPICGRYCKGRNIREERELTAVPSVKRVALKCSALEGIIMLMQIF